MFNSKANVNGAARTVLQQAANAAQPDSAPPPAALAAVAADHPASTGAGVAIALKRPIHTHKGVVGELVVRSATIADYIALGDIDTIVAGNLGDDGRPTTMEAKTNHEALIRWAVALTGIDRLVLDQMDPGDAGKMFRQVRLAVQPFSQGN